jgi:hypothetical protein
MNNDPTQSKKQKKAVSAHLPPPLALQGMFEPEKRNR